jgi:hypothetical protein
MLLSVPIVACARSAPAARLGVENVKGINGNELNKLSPDALARTIAGYRALGVRWVRFDFDWSEIQAGGPKVYDFASYDRVVDALTAADIQVLGILDYTPAWARGAGDTKFTPPKSAADFSAFAGQAAARYCGRVSAWEIWNEPNLAQFWGPAPDARAYAALLKGAAAEIRRQAPSVVIVSGGLASAFDNGRDIPAARFLEQVYEAGAGASVSAIGNHPYMSPQVPTLLLPNNWSFSWGWPGGIRAVMARHGDGRKPVWVTEFGAPTLGRDAFGTVVTEARQASLVRGAFAALPRDGRAGPLFWYNYQDFCAPDPNRPSSCFYGLVRADGTTKPGFEAYRMAGEPTGETQTSAPQVSQGRPLTRDAGCGRVAGR